MSSLAHNVHYIGLNFVGKERLDPLLEFLLSALGLAHNQFLYVCGELLICAAGMALLLSISRSRGAWLGGVWLALAMLIVLGLEPFYLKVQWFPWMLSAFVLLLLRLNFANFVPSLVLSVLFTALWIVSAGALAPFGIALAAFAAFFMALRMRSFTLVLAEEDKSYRTFAVVALTAFLLSIYFVPIYPMPDYPSGARLVHDGLFDFLPFPLLGERLHPIPVVEAVYFGLLALYAQNYLLLLCTLAVAILVSGVVWKHEVRRALLHILLQGVLGLLLVFSVLFWPQLHIGLQPFYLLMQIVPGLGYVFLPWLLIPFLLLFLTLGVFAHCRQRTIVLAILLTGGLGTLLGATGNYPPAQAHFAEFGVETGRSPYIGVTWSPSAAVVATVGPWIATPGVAQERTFSTMRRLQPGLDYVVASTSAHPNFERADRSVDGNVFSSWATKRPQMAGDYFVMEFEDVVQLARVVLSIQETPTAFPCSLGVWSEDEHGVMRPLLMQDPWPGPVFWSSDGFPYFGEKKHVVVDFPNSQRVKKLRFEILSTACHDRQWAIGEMKLYDLAVD